ncbi:unnamed protein product [Pedinophyceae sp. YPF-701]|nr:unnamed protein product [Pedinophyceae sp. YPF-701]
MSPGGPSGSGAQDSPSSRTLDTHEGSEQGSLRSAGSPRTVSEQVLEYARSIPLLHTPARPLPHTASQAALCPGDTPFLPEAARHRSRLADEPLEGPPGEEEHKMNIRQEMEHVAGETVLLLGFAGRLLWLLGIGWRWVASLSRLLVYSALLMPGFAQMILFYFFSPRVSRSIEYGRKPRQRLDLYVPRSRWFREGPRPVVVFVTGGAWIIGYKAWGALLARRLSQRGVLVASIDYRNYPQGTAVDMLEDVNTAMRWVFKRIHLYGGDPEQVFLAGQSAGSHLGATAVVQQALRGVGEARDGAWDTTGLREAIAVDEPLTPLKRPRGGAAGPHDGHGELCWPRWPAARLRGFVGVSGLYNIVQAAPHLHKRGLYRSMADRIFSVDGRTEFAALSPTLLVPLLEGAGAMALPRILLLHGDRDASAPLQQSEDFVAQLHKLGADAELKVYKGWSHTSPLIEEPMRGGTDQLVVDLLTEILGTRTDDSMRLKWHEQYQQLPLCPSVLIDAANWVCPF